MAAKLAVILALSLALTASALTQRRSGGVNEDLTSNLNSVEAEIQRKVAAAYDKGKKLGYNEGVAASREHFEADGRKLGRREGYKEGLGVGEKDGLHRGFTQGENDGKTRGYREGVRVGEAHGELEGQRLKEAQEAKMLAQLHQSLEKQ
eukprot:g810.t1